MIVWINGMAGAGKTAVAGELLRLLPGAALFDPAGLAGPLSGLLPGLGTGRPPEDSAAWRKLVADTAAALLHEMPGPLVVPMELLERRHRDEIFGLLAAYGLTLHHVLLDVDETILRARARNLNGAGRPGGAGAAGGAARSVPAGPAAPASGRANGLPRPAEYARYREVLSELRSDAYPVDPGGLGPRAAAERIAAAVSAGLARCEVVRTPKRDGDTTAAAVLLFDTDGRVLLVDPTYKGGWEFPGGVVESGEPPSSAAVRELEEELGLALDPARLSLLLVDWEEAPPGRHGGLRLVFDGGGLDSAEKAALRLPAAELRGWRFASAEDAAVLLPPVRARRLAAALSARGAGRIGYLERTAEPA